MLEHLYTLKGLRKWLVNVCDVGQDRMQGSSLLSISLTMILDDNGKIWGGGNNDGQGLGGTSQNDGQWTNGGRNSFQVYGRQREL